MLVDPLVKQTALRIREGKVGRFLGDFVLQLLDQADLLGRGQFPERLDDRFCPHDVTLRPSAVQVQRRQCILAFEPRRCRRPLGAERLHGYHACLCSGIHSDIGNSIEGDTLNQLDRSRMQESHPGVCES
jgi:hypothetical protein